MFIHKFISRCLNIQLIDENWKIVLDLMSAGGSCVSIAVEQVSQYLMKYFIVEKSDGQTNWRLDARRTWNFI